MYYRARFTHCCTAVILYDFPWDYHGPDCFETMSKEVPKKLKAMYLEGEGACVVTLINKQSKSIELLKSMGFECSEPISKIRHKGTLLHILYIDLGKWYSANCKQKLPKRDAQGRFISNNPFKK